MIRHVYERALKVKNIHKIVIATDSKKIYDICENFGAEVMMTSEDHKSGTDRVGEVATKYHDFDFYINIQGDEPLIDPELLTDFNTFLQTGKFDICTISEKIKNSEDLFDFNVVKLVKDNKDKVIYFSRNASPHQEIWPIKNGLTILHILSI